jgi:hypothetical protein
MSNVRKYFGVILLLLGFICLTIYKWALPDNALLVIAMLLELAGIIVYIRINKKG